MQVPVPSAIQAPLQAPFRSYSSTTVGTIFRRVALDDDVFEGVTSPVMVEFEHVDPPLSFDVLSRFFSCSNDVLTLSSYMDMSFF